MDADLEVGPGAEAGEDEDEGDGEVVGEDLRLDLEMFVCGGFWGVYMD